jgi:hypothetical protein
MFWPDWEHYVSVLKQPAVTTPAAHNTLFWLGQAPESISIGSATNVTLHALRENLKSMQEQQIVFIARAFNLADSVPHDLDQRLKAATDTSCEFFVLNPKWPQT